MFPTIRFVTAAVVTLAASTPPAAALWAQQRPSADPKVTRELDRLEQAALSAPRLDDRLYAAGFMTMHYGRKCDECQSVPGVVAREVKIYHQTEEPRLRRLIVDLMGLQAESAKAAAFLVEVAKQPIETPAPDSGVALASTKVVEPVQRLAIRRLRDLGQDGEKALRALHAEGAVREPRARATLADLARRGFRGPAGK